MPNRQQPAPRPGRAPRKPRPALPWSWVWLAVGAVALATVVGWVALRGGGEDEQALGADDAGVVHVHGLGINPKDNTLYAATHTGLFRIPKEGRAVRVADRHQDTMGFTVVGPDHFLGSGHPDLREMREKKLPPLLGLIESKDAGRTWRSLSLSGKADFHVLRAAHGRIYGWDSTSNAFMVSANGGNWDVRRTAPIQDFAVSPTDPDVIVASMQITPYRSADGGRSWERLNAPPMAFLAWEAPDALWGAAPGAVYRSTDGGATWQQQGSLSGSPEAFLAAGGMLYVSIHEDGIYSSADGGRIWQPLYRDADHGQRSRKP